MKWGHRKNSSQSGDSSSKKHLTTEQKVQRSKTIKKAIIGTAAVTTLAAAAIYATNPKVRSVVNSVLSKTGKTTMSALKKGGNKSVELGKKAAKEALAGAKEGIAEGIREVPKKATKAIVVGAGMMAAKRMLDKSVGKEESARIFKANNGKKIDSFWRISQEDKDDD